MFFLLFAKKMFHLFFSYGKSNYICTRFSDKVVQVGGQEFFERAK